MNVLISGSLLVAAAHVRGELLDAACRAPRLAQTFTLRRLLARARNTVFGREHGFERLRSIEDFRRAVPLRDYAALAPWLDRARRGEPDVCWPGHMPYFAMSSGTTGGNKYLPISYASVRQQRLHGFDPLAMYLRATDDRRLLEGKAILLSSTTSLEPRSGGGFVGDNTGIMARHMPRFTARNHLPSPEVRAMRAWDERLEALACESMNADVRLIAGTPSWFPALFDVVLERARKRGRRARTILELWPNLRLLTGGGVRFAPYRSLIEQRLGGSVPYFDVYNATEGGIMGVSERAEDASMRLLPDAGVFFELVPQDEIGSAAPRRCALWEVELDRPYALAVSTPSGLFGYLLGDVLRFVERFPHRFVFEGRTAAFLNVCGEHVSQGELERAVTSACASEGVALVEFSVASEVGVDGGAAARHVFIVEHEGPSRSAEQLAARIDRSLAAGNEDYEVRRQSIRGLLPPRVRSVPRGTFEAFMRRCGKLGGQHKVPRVLAAPSIVSDLLACADACSASSMPSAPLPTS